MSRHSISHGEHSNYLLLPLSCRVALYAVISKGIHKFAWECQQRAAGLTFKMDIYRKSQQLSLYPLINGHFTILGDLSIWAPIPFSPSSRPWYSMEFSSARSVDPGPTFQIKVSEVTVEWNVQVRCHPMRWMAEGGECWSALFIWIWECLTSRTYWYKYHRPSFWWATHLQTQWGTL